MSEKLTVLPDIQLAILTFINQKTILPNNIPYFLILIKIPSRLT
ncbi:hypothetical protein [Liquorilactobacillus hordei]|nr:hypothetical protein [Liquorilactobacillus hordei]